MKRLILATTTLALASCGTAATPEPTTLQTVPPTPAPPHILHVTKADFGKQWPLKVAEGTLRCDDGYSVVIVIDGIAYGLNGDARGRDEYAELDASLLKGYPSRVKTQVLIDRGWSSAAGAGVRRADPERIYQAKRAGFVARIADRMGQERAEALIAALEREATSLGLDRGSVEFWREAERKGRSD